jgi:regulator of protease activity HflC (stomatin/prohibitin superfamily)
MSYFRHVLGVDQCAVVRRRSQEPLLIRGPGSVRTFNRWRQVIVVDLSPFVIDVVDKNVTANDGVVVGVSAEVEGQVIDPVAAALKVVDYKDATRQIAQTAMRAVVMERPSSELRDAGLDLESFVADIVTDAVPSWGLVVSSLSFDVAVAT